MESRIHLEMANVQLGWSPEIKSDNEVTWSCKYCYILVEYGRTEFTRDEGKKRAFWEALDGAVKDLPNRE